MKIIKVHDFNYTKEVDFKKIQLHLKKRIKLSPISENEVKTCAGVDLAYWEEENQSFGTCSIIVIDYHSKEVIEKVCSVGKINVPYVAGYLAFRELPLIIEAAEKLTVEPDVFLFDGNGFLHYNHIGIATHASFFLNKATIGIAKTYLKIQNHDFIMPENEVGAFSDIIINGTVYGRAVRTMKNVKPVFLSCGNYIDLNSSFEIMMKLINEESRLPIPVRLADLETHRLRKKFKSD
ncbi:endonuclease V [Scopulibacillus cellulosilyticus]|uniref:Endonuclease V n=1 Tax=Scopulibacillus cellulosilyticus TaxID=2665665 RepID=A0ABW2Q2I6_9BACL